MEQSLKILVAGAYDFSDFDVLSRELTCVTLGAPDETEPLDYGSPVTVITFATKKNGKWVSFPGVSAIAHFLAHQRGMDTIQFPVLWDKESKSWDLSKLFELGVDRVYYIDPQPGSKTEQTLLAPILEAKGKTPLHFIRRGYLRDEPAIDVTNEYLRD